MINKGWDVIVIGGGHAGIEAAYISQSMGQKTLLLTMTIDSIGQMSCNPAIGGIGKGHLVKEIDALGGLMAYLADTTGIQFRTLNTKKGLAVQGTRCQSDMLAYKQEAKKVLESLPNLLIKQHEIKSLLWDKDSVCGVMTALGEKIYSKTVIVTTGTFLNGLIHIGKQQFSGGRSGELSSNGLSADLAEHGFELGRLKTGTTPRLHRKTIDFNVLEEQKGDTPQPFFSFWGKYSHLEQISCYITYTNTHTHQLIADNLDQSSIYNGQISSNGPRYCPSIEDKVVKFADKQRHQIFLEPTSLNSAEFYPNGLSTSLSLEVQKNFLRTIKGLANVEIIRPGYAIEYDYVYPNQLQATLETKMYKNLFLAGQINGTTGYEEAAAQGLMAGINAALKVQQKPEFVLYRHQAYIGVLIDDLITKSTQEPYRMFTSRAEYRLLLREDNADQRLSEMAYQIGSLAKYKYEIFLQKQETLSKLRTTISQSSIAVKDNNAAKAGKVRLEQFLKRSSLLPEDLDQVLADEIFSGYDSKIIKELIADFKYEGYIKRQKNQINQYLKASKSVIPRNIDYNLIPGLSREVQEKLSRFQPQTIGQAQQISGITPAAVFILSVYLKNKFAHF